MAAVSIEVTTREITVATGTDVTDVVLATVAGAIQSVAVNKISDDGQGNTLYQIVIVHLNA